MSPGRKLQICLYAFSYISFTSEKCPLSNKVLIHVGFMMSQEIQGLVNGLNDTYVLIVIHLPCVTVLL